MNEEEDYTSLAKKALDAANEINQYESMKAKGTGGAGRGNINPPMPGEAPSVAKKSNVVDMANKAKELAKNANLLPSEEFLLDPRNSGALSGSTLSLLKQYKDRNKIINKPPIQQPESNALKVNISKGEPSLEIYDEPSGSRALTSNQGLNKGVAQAENLAQQNLTHFLELNPDYRVTPGLLNPAGEMGPAVFENGVFRPLSVQRQILSEAANKPTVPVNPPAKPSLSTSEKLLKAFPNAPKVVEAVKGALPVIGKTLNAAGAGANIFDVGSRVLDKDYTGAGIAGAGGVLAMLAAPEIGIPIGLSSALLNYIRDHPEFASNYEKMASGNKPAPTSSQFQANPMGDY
jgi:hypothetical protein